MNQSEYHLIEGPLKLKNIKVLQGANYFSGGPVVLMRLDLGKYDEVFTNMIPGFYDKLTSLLPSLYEHHCSPGKPGGFLMRVEEGTLLGHVCEHIAIELQTLAGMDVAYGKTRSTLEQGVYNIIFRFFDEECGLFAGKAAVNILNSLLTDNDLDVFAAIEKLIITRQKNLIDPALQAIVEEANKRNIPFMQLEGNNNVQLGTGKYQKRLRTTIIPEINLIEVETNDDKKPKFKMSVADRTQLADKLVEELFPQNARCRVPLFSVTGTKGKLFSVQLIDHCLTNAGYTTGVTSSEGLFIAGKKIKPADLLNTEYVKLILKDPTIDVAVFETPLKGILQNGLGYTFADFGIVLNIRENDIGKDDIKFIEDLAYAKSVVAEQVYDEGYSVLNADSDLILEMRERIYSNIALFSTMSNNKEILKHISDKGLAVYIENNNIMVNKSGYAKSLIHLSAIPSLNNDNNTLESLLGAITSLIGFDITDESLINTVSTYIG